jgi:hypothetical protein
VCLGRCSTYRYISPVCVCMDAFLEKLQVRTFQGDRSLTVDNFIVANSDAREVGCKFVRWESCGCGWTADSDCAQRFFELVFATSSLRSKKRGKKVGQRIPLGCGGHCPQIAPGRLAPATRCALGQQPKGLLLSMGERTAWIPDSFSQSSK